MINDGFGFVIDEKELSTCINMFEEVCSDLEIVKTRFIYSIYTSEEMLKIVGKHKDGEIENFYFVLEEENGVFSITMLDQYYDVCNERELEGVSYE